jgi:hypothetical protein
MDSESIAHSWGQGIRHEKSIWLQRNQFVKNTEMWNYSHGASMARSIIYVKTMRSQSESSRNQVENQHGIRSRSAIDI